MWKAGLCFTHFKRAQGRRTTMTEGSSAANSSFIAASFALNLKWDTDFKGMGHWGHLQVYQMAGLEVFFNWKSPK